MTSLAIDYIKFSGTFRYYSTIHGEVFNLGASLDFITRILYGTNCS